MKIQIPDTIVPIYDSDKRYIVLRGGSKSWSIADFLIAKSLESQKRILCCREIQNSIRDSSHRLLTDRIKFYGLDDFFTITDKEIIGKNGSIFIFRGLFRNEQSIKSLEGVDLAWVEEAQSVSRKSLEVLIPTIRKANSQIIFSYNPTNQDDPVHTDYTLAQREDTLNIEINYSDNPFFPDVLLNEMEYDRKNDADKYSHVWLGQCISHSDSQVFYGFDYRYFSSCL